MLLTSFLKNIDTINTVENNSYVFMDGGTSGEQTLIRTPDKKLYSTGLNTSGQTTFIPLGL